MQNYSSPRFEKRTGRNPGFWILGFLFLGLRPGVLPGSESWKEVRFNDELVLVRPATEKPGVQGRLFAARGRTTVIRAASDLGEAGRAAVADIERYLPLACGGQTRISGKANPSPGYLLLLATDRSEDLLSWAGLMKELPALAEQECLILPVDAFPDGSPGIALVGGSPRGLLNGVYQLLEKSAGVFWESGRTPQPGQVPATPLAETILDGREELAWPLGKLVWKPAVSERIFYTGYAGATSQAIDWASRNRLSHLVIATPREFPLSESEERHLKNAVDQAHGLGMKALFLNMTHRLPVALRSLPPSSPEAIKASTGLFVDLVSRFGLDGFAWHSASEGIEIALDEPYRKTPRAVWEARYFNSYYSAIRKIKPDALLVMLMGWVYMNPAPEMSRLFPQDTVAWIVPNTSIIDAALTDIPSYGEHFRHIWYWLYVTVSRDGGFPLVKLDYLEKYFAEALKRGHGLAPQGVGGVNAANAMYFVRTANDGLIPHGEFLTAFGERYYGDVRMGEILMSYQQALFHHRNWYNNVHSRDVRNDLTQEEASLLARVFEGTLASARDARSPLLKDRLRVLAVTALRCLFRRSPHLDLPQDLVKGWSSEWMEAYGWNRRALEAMVPRFEGVFGPVEPGAGQDLYGEEFLKIRAALSGGHR